MNARQAYEATKLPEGCFNLLKRLRAEIEGAVADNRLFVEVSLGWEQFSPERGAAALGRAVEVLRAEQYDVAADAVEEKVSVSWAHMRYEPEAPAEPFPVGTRLSMPGGPTSEKQPDGSWARVEE